MSAAPLAVALLPGPGDPNATLASVRSEAGGEVPVATLTPGGGTDLLSAAETIAFARAGDRWRPGTLTARLRVLAAHPSAALSVAAHVLVDATGDEVVTVTPPSLPLDPVELLLRASVEPAAVLVRADALDADALALLLRPHGEVVLWNRLCARGLVRSGEIAAEVLLDPERHGAHHETRTNALLRAAAEAATAPGASALRRELLRRLYLDAAPEPQPAELVALLGGAATAGDGATDVIADLQWALERARDTLATERLPWPDEAGGDADMPGQFVDEELFDLRAAVRTMSAEIELLNGLLRRYTAEILRRDATIARLTGRPLGADAAADDGTGVPEAEGSVA